MIDKFDYLELFIDGKEVNSVGYVVLEFPLKTPRDMTFYFQIFSDQLVSTKIVMKNCHMKMMYVSQFDKKIGFVAIVNNRNIKFAIGWDTSESDADSIQALFRYCEAHKVFGLKDLASIKEAMSTGAPTPLPDFRMMYLLWTRCDLYFYIRFFQNCSVEAKKFRNYVKNYSRFNTLYMLYLDASTDHMRLVCTEYEKSRLCLHCRKFTHKRCKKCLGAYYCSRACQILHFPRHRHICQQEMLQTTRFVEALQPMRIQKYFEEFYQKPIIDFIKFRKIIHQKLYKEYKNKKF